LCVWLGSLLSELASSSHCHGFGASEICRQHRRLSPFALSDCGFCRPITISFPQSPLQSVVYLQHYRQQRARGWGLFWGKWENGRKMEGTSMSAPSTACGRGSRAAATLSVRHKIQLFVHDSRMKNTKKIKQNKTKRIADGGEKKNLANSFKSTQPS